MTFVKFKEKNLFVFLLFILKDLFCGSFFTIWYILGNKIKVITLINTHAIRFDFIQKKFIKIIYIKIEI